ncbi:MAG: 2-oxoacid:acceptor oxidoreductase family protein [Chloroflexota bacterium]|nr:2-oxoacid:acceptor oxidoreductase family protein [Chloroflexota bacterium]
MEQARPAKTEVIMAGLGGMGVLVAGQVLSCSALSSYEYVSWAPSYAVARRGGLCECTVVLSEEEIASPILDQAQSVLVFDGSQFKFFESRVRSGGIMIVEKSGLREEKEREDITLLPVAGLEIAIQLGTSMVNNLILLGVYTEISKAIAAELIEAELDNRYGGKKDVMEINKEAFRRGLELAKTM